MKRNKPRNKLGIFLIVLSVLIAGGCAGNEDSEEVGPTEGTDTEGTDTEGTDTEGTETEGTETEGTDTEGTDTEGTDTEGTDTEGTETEGTNTEGTETEETETGNDVKTDIIEVEIRDFKYIPEELTFSVGQTVRWTNYDKVIHNVVGSGLDSQDMGEGDTFTFIFEKAGTFDYICTYHPWMKGTVIVTE